MLRSCGTCRQRRRACDRTKPTCQRCSKDGVKCQGYEQEKQKLFVNFTSDNIKTRRKRVLCEAIHAQHQTEHSSEESRSSTDDKSDESTPVSSPDLPLALLSKSARGHGLQPDDLARLRVESLRTLDLTEIDFNHHVATIWNKFELGHNVTTDGWAPALTTLLHQDRSLDLAIIALSSLRLAQTNRDVQMRVLGFTAYQHSLRLHRRACEKLYAVPLGRASATPILATVSITHALFEAVQLTPKTIFENRLVQHNPHLLGAGTFVKACNPVQFQEGGEHLMFSKLREMTLLMAFASYKTTFLASEDWCSVPWAVSPKTIRDRLHDVAVQMATPLSTLLSLRTTGRVLDSFEVEKLAMQCKKIELGLERWRDMWCDSLSAPHRYIYTQLEQGRVSAIPQSDEMDTKSANVVLLGQELTALKLVLALARSELWPYRPNDAGDILQECLSTTALAAKVQKILTLPIFKLDLKEDAEGVVEGQCRSLIGGWALIEYKRLSASWG